MPYFFMPHITRRVILPLVLPCFTNLPKAFLSQLCADGARVYALMGLECAFES